MLAAKLVPSNSLCDAIVVSIESILVANDASCESTYVLFALGETAEPTYDSVA